MFRIKHFALLAILSSVVIFSIIVQPIPVQAQTATTITMVDAYITGPTYLGLQGLNNPEPGVWMVSGRNPQATIDPHVPYYWGPGSGGNAENLFDNADSFAPGPTATAPLGSGVWQSIIPPVLTGKVEMFFEPHTIVNRVSKFTVADLQQISWETWKTTLPSAVDWSLNIYISNGGNYGTLGGEPYWAANNTGALANQWNTWDTNSVNNHIRFYEHRFAGTSFGGTNLPFLSDITSGPIDWAAAGTASALTVDYRNWEVEAIAISVGSGWAATFEGYLDNFNFSLNNSGVTDTFTVDYELAAPLVPTILVVTPSVQQGWIIVPYSNTAQPAPTTGYVTGPGTPPAGTGSYYTSIDVSDSKIIFIRNNYHGLPVSWLTEFTYWTYRASATSRDWYVNFYVDLDSDGTYDGRLDYEPTPAGAVGVWRQVDVFSGNWISNFGFSGTLAQFNSAYPNALFNAWADPNAGAVRLNMGDTASSFLNYSGNIDGIHIAHLRVGDILYDFEPEPIIPVVVSPPAVGIFDPAISKIGFLLPGQVGLSDEQLEWIVTVSNLGNAPGNNVVVTDTLGTALQIDNVDAPGATVNISGQTVTVTYATINPGDTVQFSIFTTVLDGAIMINTACVADPTQASGEECATALPITILPRTGELPERSE